MRTQITNLAAKFDTFSELAHKNQAEIVNLKTQNAAFTRENHELKTDMANVKEERRNDGNGDLEVRIVTLTKQINDIVAKADSKGDVEFGGKIFDTRAGCFKIKNSEIVFEKNSS